MSFVRDVGGGQPMMTPPTCIRAMVIDSSRGRKEVGQWNWNLRRWKQLTDEDRRLIYLTVKSRRKDYQS